MSAVKKYFQGSQLLENYYIGVYEVSGIKKLVFVIKIWNKVFKSGPSKICGRQPLKNLKGYGLLKQTISLQIL